MSTGGAGNMKAGKIFSVFAKMSTRNKLLVLGIIAVAFTFAFPIISVVSGNKFGTAVGTAVGTFHAVTEDMPAAYSQGVEDGISANDVRTSNENTLREVGRLDVLAANAELTDFHSYGDKYAAIYTLGADVTFSVDISKVQVYAGEGRTIIKVPEPVAEVNIDSTKTRLEAEYKRVFRDGSTEKGIEGYINSMKAIQSDARETLKDYPGLEKKAMDAAEKQIKMIYESISGESNVEVQFMETAGDNNE